MIDEFKLECIVSNLITDNLNNYDELLKVFHNSIYVNGYQTGFNDGLKSLLKYLYKHPEIHI